MQALTRLVNLPRKRLETYRCVDEIAQHEFCRIWLAVEEKRERFIEHRLGKCWVAFGPCDHVSLKSRVSAIHHLGFVSLALRRL